MKVANLDENERPFRHSIGVPHESPDESTRYDFIQCARMPCLKRFVKFGFSDKGLRRFDRETSITALRVGDNRKVHTVTFKLAFTAMIFPAYSCGSLLTEQTVVAIAAMSLAPATFAATVSIVSAIIARSSISVIIRLDTAGRRTAVNCRNQAIAQACAFCSPFLGVLSAMAIFRQSRW